MKRSEFRNIIKECLCELLTEQSFDHTVDSDQDGRHPKYKHLIYYEFEPHHGSYIVTAPKTTTGNVLLSAEDVASGFGNEAIDNEFAYGSDEYLEYLTESIYKNNKTFDKHQLSRETGKYISSKIGNKNWPSFEDFQSILNNRRILSMLNKYPLEKAAERAAEMILAVSRNPIREHKEKVLKVIMKRIISETTESPEHPWTKVSGYIGAYAAVPDNVEVYEDRLYDAIAEQINKLQNSKIQNIKIQDIGSKRGYTFFKLIVEFLYESHPDNEISIGVYEVAENIPYILSSPSPKIDVTTDMGGWDTPKR